MKIHPQDILIIPQHTFQCVSKGRGVTRRKRGNCWMRMTPSTTYHPPIEEEEEVIISQYTIIVLVDEKTKLCETVNEQAKP